MAAERFSTGGRSHATGRAFPGSTGMTATIRFLLLVPLCLLLGGCSKIERARHCRTLVATVNPALGSIQELVATNRLDVAFYEDIAVRYEALAAELERRAFASLELKTLVEEYRSVLTGAARAVRGVAQSRTNPQALPQSKLELERLVRREKVLVLKMDAECHAP